MPTMNASPEPTDQIPGQGDHRDPPVHATEDSELAAAICRTLPEVRALAALLDDSGGGYLTIFTSPRGIHALQRQGADIRSYVHQSGDVYVAADLWRGEGRSIRAQWSRMATADETALIPAGKTSQDIPLEHALRGTPEPVKVAGWPEDAASTPVADLAAVARIVMEATEPAMACTFCGSPECHGRHPEADEEVSEALAHLGEAVEVEANGQRLLGEINADPSQRDNPLCALNGGHVRLDDLTGQSLDDFGESIGCRRQIGFTGSEMDESYRGRVRMAVASMAAVR